MITDSDRRSGCTVSKGGNNMKGYTTDAGYMGYVNGNYILFACEADYRDCFAGEEN